MAHGVNYWIPFTEEEVGAKECFKSHFMSDFLRGKMTGSDTSDVVATQGELELGGSPVSRIASLSSHVSLLPLLSPAARAVFDAGRELWRYYHAQPNANPNASYYDIRLHFQGAKVDAKGKAKMNSESSDATYTALLAKLRVAMKNLAREIEPKVYQYGFLKR